MTRNSWVMLSRLSKKPMVNTVLSSALTPPLSTARTFPWLMVSPHKALTQNILETQLLGLLEDLYAFGSSFSVAHPAHATHAGEFNTS
jgi:hypothetical protein